jgi:hypothetical protein
LKVFIFVVDCGDGSTSLDFVAEHDLEIFTELYEYNDSYNDGDGFGAKYVLTFDSVEDAISSGVGFWSRDDYYEE